MKLFAYSLIAAIAVFTTACTAPGSEGPHPDGIQTEKGIVKGRVLDAGGNPVAKAEIVASSTDFYNKTSTGYTDAAGNYSFKLPTGIAAGSYTVSGTITAKYHNRNYVLALYEENSNVFSAYDGAVRNFVFRLTGKRTAADDETSLPLGATLEVNHDFNFLDPANVEITMEPTGPLVDGSTGKKIVASMSANSSYIRDIPVGYYKFTARDKSNGETLGVNIHGSNKANASSVTGLFEPSQFEGSTFYDLVINVGKL